VAKITGTVGDGRLFGTSGRDTIQGLEAVMDLLSVERPA